MRHASIRVTPPSATGGGVAASLVPLRFAPRRVALLWLARAWPSRGGGRIIRGRRARRGRFGRRLLSPRSVRGETWASAGSASEQPRATESFARLHASRLWRCGPIARIASSYRLEHAGAW